MTGKVQLINCLSADDILQLFKYRELFQGIMYLVLFQVQIILKKFTKLTLSLFRDLRRRIQYKMITISSHIVQICSDLIVVSRSCGLMDKALDF
jgi:hypothetical protein